MTKSNEIHTLKSGKENEELAKLHEENSILNKQLMIYSKEVESKNQMVEKYNELQKQCSEHVESLIAEKLINEELQKLYTNLEEVNESLTEKLKRYAMLEPNEFIKDFEEVAFQTTNLVGKNEELCSTNEELRSENALLKSNYNTCVHQVKELNIELEKIQKLYNLQEQANKDFISKIEQVAVNTQAIKEDYEKLKSEYDKLQRDHEKINSDKAQLQHEHDDLIANNDNLKKLNETLTHDYEQLRVKYEELETNKEAVQKPSDQRSHEKYISVISDKIQKIVHPDFVSESRDEDPEISEFSKNVDEILQPLLSIKNNLGKLQDEIFELTDRKNTMVAEKNLEIEKLLKNSELLSQEVISKSHSLKDAEDECAELMKNNDLLITELDNYRKSSNLQTISESNEDNLLLLEIQLENANKRLQELESIIIDLETSKEDNAELELIKNHLSMTSQELNHTKEQFTELLSRYKQLEEDKLVLKSMLDKTKSDFENTEYKYTELTINFDSLKEENEQLKDKHADLVIEYEKLILLKSNLENEIPLLQEAEQEANRKLNLEVENSKEKEIQIKDFVERLQNSKMSETSWKLQVDTLHKELQTATEAKKNLEEKYELCINDFEKYKEEHINKRNEEYVPIITELERQLKELTISRDDLINLVRSKHEENVKYHDEIQRLNLHLSTEVGKATMLEKQLNELSVDNVSHEEIIQKCEELEKLKDQNSFLKEKCEILTQNLLQEQSNVQKVLHERQSAIDKEILSSKELERLRLHLVEIEEGYTQELLQAEQKNKEMLMKVNEIEQREKDSNSIYTSVNIRANQQVETLQTQLQLVTSQREELRAVISDLEDKENKQIASLTNLQLVLEQFQRDKEKDVEQETERIRRQIGIEKQIQEDLRNDIGSLKLQLEGSKQGLQAASRLSDQLEKSKQQACHYKDEMTKLQEQLQICESRCKELTGSSDLKVDKTLIKNLVLGYISNSNDQGQILKIIATVLDFNQKESEKANLNKPAQGGWLSTILNPQSLHPDQHVNQQSLSEAFVRFLENESKPKIAPNLLMATQQSKDNSNNGNGNSRQSPHTLHEVVLPTFEDFGSSRSSSSILKGVLKNNG